MPGVGVGCIVDQGYLAQRPQRRVAKDLQVLRVELIVGQRAALPVQSVSDKGLVRVEVVHNLMRVSDYLFRVTTVRGRENDDLEKLAQVPQQLASIWSHIDPRAHCLEL